MEGSLGQREQRQSTSYEQFKNSSAFTFRNEGHPGYRTISSYVKRISVAGSSSRTRYNIRVEADRTNTLSLSFFFSFIFKKRHDAVIATEKRSLCLLIYLLVAPRRILFLNS